MRVLCTVCVVMLSAVAGIGACSDGSSGHVMTEQESREYHRQRLERLRHQIPERLKGYEDSLARLSERLDTVNGSFPIERIDYSGPDSAARKQLESAAMESFHLATAGRNKTAEAIEIFRWSEIDSGRQIGSTYLHATLEASTKCALDTAELALVLLNGYDLAIFADDPVYTCSDDMDRTVRQASGWHVGPDGSRRTDGWLGGPKGMEARVLVEKVREVNRRVIGMVETQSP